jgi:UDP-N-acetylglucosamine 4,6-dehydratase
VDVLIQNPNPPVVNITHEEMTRFWIDLDGSFKLVLFALENMAGGEIFVPKIGSMKLVDIFDLMAPKAKKNFVGIRPGEKMHEILLTAEEARHSYELKDYYAVLPEHGDIFNISKRFQKIIAKGKKLPSDFSFMSHTNKNWLTKEMLAKMIETKKTKHS